MSEAVRRRFGVRGEVIELPREEHEDLMTAVTELVHALALAAIPIEALTAVHSDAKWIAPGTVEALVQARDAIRAVIPTVERARVVRA